MENYNYEDTKYKTNRYGMVLWICVGINSEREII